MSLVVNREGDENERRMWGWGSISMPDLNMTLLRIMSSLPWSVGQLSSAKLASNMKTNP